MRCARLFTLTFLITLRAFAAPEWVERSNEISQTLVDAMGAFAPETLSYWGIEGYDDQVADVGSNGPQRFRDAMANARLSLDAQLDREENPFVRQDISILIDAAADSIRESELAEQYLLPFADAAQTIYQSEFILLQPDIAPERRAQALDRLRRYAGLLPGTKPFTEELRARYEEAMAADPSRLAPFRDRVQQVIANRERFVAGLEQSFAGSEFAAEEVEPVLATLSAQLAAYGEWVESTVLPAARDDYRLPPEVYADNLHSFGLDIEPTVLMQRAQTAFAEIRNEMRVIARLVAAERGWEETEYPAVIRRLKQEQLTADAVLPYYEGIIAQIEDIIRREHIVTLPDRPMAIRIASEAENAAQPAPHMDPPSMTGDTDERGTFVLTSGTPPAEGVESESFDDFTFEAATWTLTAHEGRPGHELQFAAMVERGVSLARSFFAFNSVNVEGWALYAEAELKPYEPLEGQLIALQHRLLRATRAFLDPMLNLGLIDRDEARRVLREDVVLSEGMVKQEVDRYTFRAPGQATSYFYGYQRLMALRTATEVALGDKFDRLAFNDFVIHQGLLPPDLLAEAVQNEFIPAHR